MHNNGTNDYDNGCDGTKINLKATKYRYGIRWLMLKMLLCSKMLENDVFSGKIQHLLSKVVVAIHARTIQKLISIIYSMYMKC